MLVPVVGLAVAVGLAAVAVALAAVAALVFVAVVLAAVVALVPAVVPAAAWAAVSAPVSAVVPAAVSAVVPAAVAAAVRFAGVRSGVGPRSYHPNECPGAGSPFGGRSFYGLRGQNSAASSRGSRPGSAIASVFTRKVRTRRPSTVAAVRT